MQAATLYLQLGGWANLDRAKDMLDEVLQVQPSYPQAQNLKAWIELALEEEEAEATGGIDRALSIFNQARLHAPPRRAAPQRHCCFPVPFGDKNGPGAPSMSVEPQNQRTPLRNCNLLFTWGSLWLGSRMLRR